MTKEQSTVTIDLRSIRSQVHDNNADSPYHDLDYLNTNVFLPALSALKARLDEGTDLSQEERRNFIEGLNTTLQHYGRRAPEAKELSGDALINHCADTLKPDSNNVERVAARALRALNAGNNTTAEVKESFDAAMREYETATKKQTANDIVERSANAIVDTDGVITRFDPTTSRELTGELTGEQLGFINSLWNQGKFAGGQAVAMLNFMDNPYITLDSGRTIQDHGSQCYIKKEEGKTYAVYTKPFYSIDTNGESPQYTQVGSLATIVDITALKGDTFTPGCASSPVPTKIQVTGDKDIVDAMSIPKNIRTTPSDAEKRILASCLDPLQQIACNIAIEVGQKPNDAKEQLTQENLSNYLSEQCPEGEEITSSKKQKLEQGIATILSPLFPKDKSQTADVNKAARDIMRDIIDAGKVKLEWKTSIANAVSNAIEFLKDKLGFGEKIPENSASKAIADKMRASLQAHGDHIGPRPSATAHKSSLER
jgi:hypothetical protein